MYHLSKNDVYNLIRSCEVYQETTGSEYIWERYQRLIEKLKLYYDQNYEEDVGNTSSNYSTNIN